VTFILSQAILFSVQKIGCYVEGECQAAQRRSAKETASAAECHLFCISDGNCTNWTFYPEGDSGKSECVTFANCPKLNEIEQTSAISGEGNCNLE